MFNVFLFFSLELIRKIGVVNFIFLIGSGLWCFAILEIDIEQPITRFDWLLNVSAWFFVVLGVIGVCVHIRDMVREKIRSPK